MLITQLKFSNKLIYAKILAELFINHLSYLNEPLPQCIIPVPLHRSRLRERGFNQALELAKPIAKRLAIPLDFKSCTRVIATKAQSQILASERKKNIKNAFVIKQNFQYQHVAIVDDVMTTGSTVAELSKTLRKHGVKQIDIWCMARTSKNR
jgi:ComF family protein